MRRHGGRRGLDVSSSRRSTPSSDEGIAQRQARRRVDGTLSNLVVLWRRGCPLPAHELSSWRAPHRRAPPLPNAPPDTRAGLVAFAVVALRSGVTGSRTTTPYGVFYEECGRQRIEPRRAPAQAAAIGFFGRRDLADLTETLMGDVKATEHAYSHVLGELYGAYIASVTVCVASACSPLTGGWRSRRSGACPVGLRRAVSGARPRDSGASMACARACAAMATSEDNPGGARLRSRGARDQPGGALPRGTSTPTMDAAEREASHGPSSPDGLIAVNGASDRAAPGPCHHGGRGRGDGRLRAGLLHVHGAVRLPAWW